MAAVLVTVEASEEDLEAATVTEATDEAMAMVVAGEGPGIITDTLQSRC